MSLSSLLENDGARWKNLYVNSITASEVTSTSQTLLGVPSVAATATKYLLSCRVGNDGVVVESLSGGITCSTGGTGIYNFTLTGLTSSDSICASAVTDVAALVSVERTSATTWRVRVFDQMFAAMNVGVCVQVTCY